MRQDMQGAEVILRTAVAAGVDVCFVNPGTTELPIVAALEKVPEMRPILGLFEGVLAGAADGYARLSGRPSLVLVHQGPSLGNAIANLHNARRARSPVVVVVGEQPTWHRAADAPLATDVDSLARVVSGHVHTSAIALEVGDDIATAIAEALGPPGGVATLIVPADCQWEASRLGSSRRAQGALVPVDPARVRDAAIVLRAGGAALLLGGAALGEAGLRDAARIAAATGAKLFVETFPARLACGQGLPELARMPYGAELAAAAFGGVSSAVLAGAGDPVAFFGHEGGTSRLLPAATKVVPLASPFDDVLAALAALADELHAPAFAAPSRATPPRPGGRLAPRTLVAALAHLLPDRAIVVDEGVSIAGALLGVSAGASRHDYLALTGGACGQGLACAAGAALAAPDRTVIALVGDGSALYAPQALWTQARESLHVVNLVVANGAYRILEAELVKLTGSLPGPRAERLTRLDRPAIDWPAIAKGFGVPSFVADSTDGLLDALGRAFATPGPSLVEARL